MDLKPNSRIFLDTCVLIYLFEDHPVFGEKIAALLRKSADVNASFVTSLITYVEILTRPERQARSDLATKYRHLLTNTPNLRIHPFDISVADLTVKCRARHNLRTPDAIQIATAMAAKATLIVTNDKRWACVPDIPIAIIAEME